ncbi:MAG TPA: hypothetical protein VEW07_04920 [Solirubrobacterales bacterium]|nr:hypothetical protein [Solirubrobacterales bacterium]
MTQPTILDADGTQLSKGMRVTCLNLAGTVGETARHGNGHSHVVHFIPDDQPSDPAKSAYVSCWISPETNRAPDLKAVLTPDPEESQ